MSFVLNPYILGTVSVPNGFTTEWETTTSNESITLPLYNSGTFNATVYWGDGSSSPITAYNDARITHSYANAGTYRVTIAGECPSWSFNNAGDKTKIKKIIYWGSSDVFGGFSYLTGGFYGCNKLSDLGSGKILSKSGLTNLQAIFSGCVSVSSIPSGILDNCTYITASGFYDSFRGTSISSIPSGLFDYNTGVSTSGFFQTFYGCSYLTSIPNELFRYNTAVSTSGFKSAFTSCSSLQSIPNELFKYNTSVATDSFYGTFQACTSINKVGIDLFRTCTGNTSYYSTFLGCTSLTYFPTHLTIDITPSTDWDIGDVLTGQTSGSTCEVVEKLSSTSYIVKKHNGIYEDGEEIGVTGNASKLANQGSGYPLLTGILDGATTNTLNLERFALSCSGLTHLPTDFFRYVKITTGLVFAFSNCSSLTYLPKDLFKHNTTVTFTGRGGSGTAGAFQNCTSLETIPVGLFKYNTAGTQKFRGVFTACQKLQMHSQIFCLTGEESTRFLNTSPDFSTFFNLTGVTFDGTQGTAPELWNSGVFDYGTGTPVTTDCFKGCSTSLSNWASIPTAWGGPL